MKSHSLRTSVIQAIRRDQCQANNDYHTVYHKGQSIGARHRSGLNPLNKHMHRIHVSHTMWIERADCQEHCESMKKYWLFEVTLNQKLHGTKKNFKQWPNSPWKQVWRYNHDMHVVRISVRTSMPGFCVQITGRLFAKQITLCEALNSA
ncbi:hypothetical protein BsWGS_01435 [Bradybaena similaris]